MAKSIEAISIVVESLGETMQSSTLQFQSLPRGRSFVPVPMEGEFRLLSKWKPIGDSSMLTRAESSSAAEKTQAISPLRLCCIA